MSKRLSLEGQRFNKLVVLSFKEQKSTHAIWNVLCDCGKKFTATSSNLKSGNTTKCQSCGQLIHGMTGTKFYKRWLGILERHKKTNMLSKDWFKFEDFMHDVYNHTKENYSIRRYDNTLPFSKENCYLSLKSEDRRIKNKRLNLLTRTIDAPME